MKDNYDKICSESQQLMFTRQHKDKENGRARDKALKDARDKARVGEEERHAVRDKYDKRWQEDMQFEQFLDYKQKKSIRHILEHFHSISWHTFPLCVHSHHGLSKIIHTPKLYTHPRYPLLISYVLAQARPTMIYIH